MNKKGKSLRVSALFKHREVTLVFMIVLLFVIISPLEPAFLSQSNIVSTLLSVALKGIIGIGTTLIIISGHLDLSVGGMVAAVCASFGFAYLKTESVFLAACISLATALLFGVINAVLITKCRLSAFIATLATMGITRGVTYVLTKGTPIKLTTLPDSYQKLGTMTIAHIPVIIIVFILLVIVFQVLLAKSKKFRQIIYTGSNGLTAQLSGVNTRKVIFTGYILIALLCWIAACLSSARFLTASPTYATSWETDLIAAAVIGGATLDGGEGSLLGTALGLILLGFVNSAIVFIGVSVYWQTFISNLVLLIAVLLDSFVEARKKKAMRA